MNNNSTLLNFLFIVIFLSICFGILISINRIILLEQGVFDGFFNHRYMDVRLETLIHVCFGLCYLILAPLLISNRIRRNSIRMHRFMGKICLLSGLITGIYAWILQFSLSHGVLISINGWVFSTLFLVALCLAYINIKKKNIARHREWMIRAFSFAIGAFVIVRIFSSITFTAFTNVDLLSTKLEITTQSQISLIESILFLASWMGTLVPALIGELVIRTNRKITLQSVQTASAM